MLILVFGGSGSGKSDVAEALAVKGKEWSRYYLATMQNDGSPEGRARIKKHREKRKNKGFRTLEWERDLRGHLSRLEIPAEKSVFLLEDLGNLVANELFSEDGAFAGCPPEETEKQIEESIVSPLRDLSDEGHRVLVVSDLLDEDGPVCGDGLVRYDTYMGMTARALAQCADGAVEVIAGIPRWIRGDETMI